ncbi:fluoride efflux transporter FluC [Paenibacillus turpanensis]|uniref:fluoride efflux transporter FluC n=1 Tax=Paenibacillus turpanensis TaxID=2689078 RepID=UPI00140870F0|nr:CrcB family protein [Paenibacillus turpanensis]
MINSPSPLWINLLMIGIGAFAGAVARYRISLTLSRAFPSKPPYGTLTVNLIGSFALGLLLAASDDEWLRLLAGTGFLGAFTTFSTLKTEGERWFREGRTIAVIIYFAATYIGGIALAFAALSIIR